MEIIPCGRDHAEVPTAAGGDQPRGEAAWGRSTRVGIAGTTRRKRNLSALDCSNAFSAVKRTAVLTEAATYVPDLTPFVDKWYGKTSAPVFYQMDSGERRKIYCSSGMPQADAMGPALFCMPPLPVLKRTQEEFEPRGVETFAYLDDVSIGMVEVTSDTVHILPFLPRGLACIGLAMNPSKTVPLHPKGHVPTLDEIA